MAEEKDIFTRIKEQYAADTAQAQEAVNVAQQAYDAWQQGTPNARLKLFEQVKPEIDTDKEKKLRDYGKAQAITDFLTALTTGLVGVNSKGYAPVIGNNSQPYTVEHGKLQAINDKRKEQYEQTKAQAEYNEYLRQGQEKMKELDEAKRRAEKTKAIENAWYTNAYNQEQHNKRHNEQIKSNETIAGIRANASSSNKDEKSKDVWDFGDGVSITIPKNVDIVGTYYALVGNGVKKRLEDKTVYKTNPRGQTVRTIEQVEKAPKTEAEFKVWLGENLEAALPYLYGAQNVKITGWKPQEVATPTPTQDNNPTNPQNIVLWHTK